MNIFSSVARSLLRHEPLIPMTFVEYLSRKSLAAQQKRAEQLEQRRAEVEAKCQQWLEQQIKRFKEHCIEQSEHGKNSGKMFLSEIKWPKGKKDECFELLKQELQKLGFEKVEIKFDLVDKWRGSGAFSGLMFVSEPAIHASWKLLPNECIEEEPQVTGGLIDTCAICAEVRPLVVLVPCGHVVCADCHSKRITQRCPFCRKDELLEILSQAKRPQAVQPHLRKCFDNLVKLKFGDGTNSTDIHAMISGEGEEIPFYKMLKARNGVEKWLSAEGGVEEYMVKTMRAEVKKGWETYAQESDRKEWVRKQYCQVMITVGSIYWTLETEEVLTATDGNKVQLMGKWFHKNKTQLEGLTELIRDKLNKLQRKGVVA
eukprot:s5012_g1.t1